MSRPRLPLCYGGVCYNVGWCVSRMRQPKEPVGGCAPRRASRYLLGTRTCRIHLFFRAPSAPHPKVGRPGPRRASPVLLVAESGFGVLHHLPGFPAARASDRTERSRLHSLRTLRQCVQRVSPTTRYRFTRRDTLACASHPEPSARDVSHPFGPRRSTDGHGALSSMPSRRGSLWHSRARRWTRESRVGGYESSPPNR